MFTKETKLQIIYTCKRQHNIINNNVTAYFTTNCNNNEAVPSE